MPCHRSTFKAIQVDEADLPQEYKNTQVKNYQLYFIIKKI